MIKLKEKLSHLSFLKNKDLDDRSIWGESGIDNLIGNLDDDSIIDANEENF